MRYLRCNLGFSGFGILVLLAFFKREWHFLAFWHFGIFFASWHFDHLGIFGIFGILASGDNKKKNIITDQSCLDLGIFALLCCFLLNFIMPKCQRCQKCQNGQNTKMPKKDAKTRKCLKAKICFVWSHRMTNLFRDLKISYLVCLWQGFLLGRQDCNAPYPFFLSTFFWDNGAGYIIYNTRVKCPVSSYLLK